MISLIRILKTFLPKLFPYLMMFQCFAVATVHHVHQIQIITWARVDVIKGLQTNMFRPVLGRLVGM